MRVNKDDRSWFTKNIKHLDAFTFPLFLYLHRRDKQTNLKKHDWKMGSAVGGINTIILVLFSIGIFSSMMFEMLDGQNDIIHKTLFRNDFKGGNEVLNLTDFNFLPTIEISGNGKNTKETLKMFDLL
jgi:hypothetical protein